MGDSFLRNTLFFIGLFLCLSGLLQAQDCPDQATFSIVHEQTAGGNDGEITVTFSGLHGDMTPAGGEFQYHLWCKEAGGYVYDDGSMDPGLCIDPDIKFAYSSPGTITFRNVPPASGYTVIVTSSACQKQFMSRTGEIIVKAFNQQGE